MPLRSMIEGISDAQAGPPQMESNTPQRRRAGGDKRSDEAWGAAGDWLTAKL